MKRASLAALAVLAVQACAPGGDPVQKASAPVVGGVSDTGDPSVVMVFFQNMPTMQEASCTATVVSPHVLLTAAHCVDPKITDTLVAEPQTYYVFLGDDINSAT